MILIYSDGEKFLVLESLEWSWFYIYLFFFKLPHSPLILLFSAKQNIKHTGQDEGGERHSSAANQRQNGAEIRNGLGHKQNSGQDRHSDGDSLPAEVDGRAQEALHALVHRIQDYVEGRQQVARDQNNYRGLDPIGAQVVCDIVLWKILWK